MACARYLPFCSFARKLSVTQRHYPTQTNPVLVSSAKKVDMGEEREGTEGREIENFFRGYSFRSCSFLLFLLFCLAISSTYILVFGWCGWTAARRFAVLIECGFREFTSFRRILTSPRFRERSIVLSLPFLFFFFFRFYGHGFCCFSSSFSLSFSLPPLRLSI